MGSNDQSDDSWMDQFLEELAQEPDSRFPDWQDASDLSRLHVQSFTTIQAGGFLIGQSSGSLRLTGEGVRGHSLDLLDAGRVLAGFQNLITSSGAAREGATTLRGAVPRDIVQKTTLALVSSPGEGSVVLNFEPVVDETVERYPNGAAMLEGQPTPLIEQSVDLAFEILAVASSPGISGEAVDELLKPLGPRVASAALALAEIASNAQLDMNVAWERPNEGRKYVSVSASQAATFAALLYGRNLDRPVEQFEGILRTISDRRRIEVETSDSAIAGERDSIVVSIVGDEVDVTTFRVGDRVTVKVRVQLTYRPGGSEKRSYTAIYISGVTEEET